MRVFQSHIQESEKKNNTAVKCQDCKFPSMTFLLNVKICSSKLDALTEAKHTEGLDADCDKLCAEGNCLYERCIEYLEKWMEPMEEFSSFM